MPLDKYYVQTDTQVCIDLCKFKISEPSDKKKLNNPNFTI